MGEGPTAVVETRGGMGASPPCGVVGKREGVEVRILIYQGRWWWGNSDDIVSCRRLERLVVSGEAEEGSWPVKEEEGRWRLEERMRAVLGRKDERRKKKGVKWCAPLIGVLYKTFFTNDPPCAKTFPESGAKHRVSAFLTPYVTRVVPLCFFRAPTSLLST
jgi:hypothetical protein